MPPEPAPERVISNYVAVARCASCEWSASMTGDTEDEVTYFLHALLMEHAARLHRSRSERPS